MSSPVVLSSPVLPSSVVLCAMRTALVVAAVVAGLLVGALSCAIGLGAGVDHVDHALVDRDRSDAPVDLAHSTPPTPVAQLTHERSTHGNGHGSSVRHGRASIESDQAAATPSPAAHADPAPKPGSEKEPATPTSHVGDAHPGMACVTAEKFGIDELVVPTTTRIHPLQPTAQPLGCQYAPEPPVPKFS